MDWIPVVFITFKLTIIGTALFFSIKTHREKAKEEQEEERQRQARASGTGSAIQRGPVHGLGGHALRRVGNDQSSADSADRLGSEPVRLEGE